MTLLQIRGLSVALGPHRVLEDLSIETGPGRMIGLIGPNGAGKTTLLKSIAGLLPVQTGEIRLNGELWSGIDPKRRARILAYLPQDGSSHWDVSVETLVMLGRLPHQNRWQSPTDADRAAVHRALTACDVLQFRQRSVDQLSGGERSRVMLARAMAGEPQILLADEPISDLDPGHALDILGKLVDLTRAGMTVVAVMHDLTLAARFCDELLLLHSKNIAASGAPEAVLTEENLARCYGVRAFQGTAEGGPVIVPISRAHGGET